MMIWGALVTIAIMREPRTYAAYLPHLRALRVSTRTGGPWSAQLVAAEMAKRGVNAKSLLDRVTRPLPFQRRKDWPVAIYKAYSEALTAVDKPGEQTGVWISATRTEPARFDLVRHSTFGEGQMVRQISLSRYACSFLVAEQTEEIACSASEIEIFQYHRSKEQRIAFGQRARDRLFRKP